MGENFFKSFLGGGGGNNTLNSDNSATKHNCPVQQYFGNNNQKQTPIALGSNSTLEDTDDKTRVNVSMVGGENKQVSIPRNTSFKDLSSTIKELFGMNNKSTLCIKYENNNGDMYSVASDCQLKKATDDGKSQELRLVVKDLAATTKPKCESLFSYFFEVKKNAIDSVLSNYTATSTSTPNSSAASTSAVGPSIPGSMATPEFLKSKPSQTENQHLDSNNIKENSSNVNNNSNTLHHLHNSQIHFHNNSHSHHHPHNNHQSTASIFRPISTSFTPIVNNSKPSILYSGRDYSTNNNNNNNSNGSNTTSPLNIHSKLSSSPKTIPSPTSASSLKNSFTNICKSPNNTSTNNNSNNNNNNTVLNKNLSKVEDEVKLNRNLSFDFNMDLMEDDDNNSIESNSSQSQSPIPSITVDAVMSENNSVKQTKEESEVNVKTCERISPLPVCAKQQKEQQGQCKELANFMGEITKLFMNLRSSNSTNEQSDIKESICDKIHSQLKIMPWILGVFPQLTQFVNQTCQFSVPPNTPPPSPSHTSPLLDMTMKNTSTSSSVKNINSKSSIPKSSSSLNLNCASVYQINSNVEDNNLQSQIQLLTKYDQEYNNNNNQQIPQSPSKPSNSYKDNGPSVHKGTKCSLCSHSPIIGNLYRCSNCEKFMFCEFCKNEKSSALDQKCILPDAPHQIILISKPQIICNPNNNSNNSNSNSLSSSGNSINNSSNEGSININSNTTKENSNTIVSNSSSNNYFRGCPYQRKQFKCTYNIKFVADLTLPLGSVAKPGQNLVKTWKVVNNGPTLPSDCLLVRICGNTRLSKIPSINIQSPVYVGETFNISVPFTVPQIPPQCNEYLVGEYWRLCTADGLYFGDKLWLSLAIRNDNTSTDPILEPFSNLNIIQQQK